MLDKIAQNVYSPYDESGTQQILFTAAKGSYLYDKYGKEYIDLVNGKGSVMVGHNEDSINQAIITTLNSNICNYSGPAEQLYVLSNEILDSVSMCHAKIAYFGTGTAACRAAIGAARAVTGKRLIVSAGYHGWDPMWDIWDKDILEVNNHAMVNFFFIPELLQRIIDLYHEQIALVIISPDYTYLSKETLLKILNICRENKLLVCCDDVKQGFRYRYGTSLAQITGMSADLYTFSKGLANGHRLSCVVGREEVLLGANNYSFTSYFDMISISAALATLKFMKSNNAYEVITNRGMRLLNNMRKICKDAMLPIEVNGSGPVFHFVFGSDNLQQAFYREAVRQGICFYEGDNQCLSWSFDDNVISDYLLRFTAIIETISSQFKHMRGQQVNSERTFTSAWCMIDGASDVIPVDERIKLIRKYNLK